LLCPFKSIEWGVEHHEVVQPEALGKPEVIAGRSGGEARGEGGLAMRETSAAVGQRMGREEERTLEDADLFHHVETQK